MGNIYGTRSKAVKRTLHRDLEKICDLAIVRSPVDFGLHAGGRTVAKQQEYYDKGKSKINPRRYASVKQLLKVAKHVIDGKYRLKSEAVDFHISEKLQGKSLTWDIAHLSLVVGVFFSCAQELYEKGEISHLIRWGGDWDGDGVILYDQSFDDGPHIELIKP